MPCISDASMLDARSLRQAFGQFATGVTVVTARAASGEAVGVTASSFNTVSLAPPMVLWSLGQQARSFATFATATHFAVHVLAAGQRALSERFARPGEDKFAGLAVRSGLAGLPLIEAVDTVFECVSAHRYAGGDHLILVGEVQRLRLPEQAAPPLLFCQGQYAALA